MGGPPSNGQILRPETWARVALPRKRNFADGIKLRVLTWPNDPGLSRVPLLAGGRRAGARKRQRLENATLLALRMDEDATGQGAQLAKGLA